MRHKWSFPVKWLHLPEFTITPALFRRIATKSSEIIFCAISVYPWCPFSDHADAFPVALSKLVCFSVINPFMHMSHTFTIMSSSHSMILESLSRQTSLPWGNDRQAFCYIFFEVHSVMQQAYIHGPSISIRDYLKPISWACYVGTVRVPQIISWYF